MLRWSLGRESLARPPSNMDPMVIQWSSYGHPNTPLPVMPMVPCQATVSCSSGTAETRGTNFFGSPGRGNLLPRRIEIWTMQNSTQIQGRRFMDQISNHVPRLSPWTNHWKAMITWAKVCLTLASILSESHAESWSNWNTCNPNWTVFTSIYILRIWKAMSVGFVYFVYHIDLIKICWF